MGECSRLWAWAPDQAVWPGASPVPSLSFLILIWKRGSQFLFFRLQSEVGDVKALGSLKSQDPKSGSKPLLLSLC